MSLSFDDKAKDFLIEKGYDPKFGARPLRKTIQRHVEDELSELYLSGKIKTGSTIRVTSEEGKINMIVVDIPALEAAKRLP